MKLEEQVNVIWKDIVGYEGIYKISEYGDVVSLKRECGFGSRREEKPKTISIKKGYASVALCREKTIKHFLLHRLVAQAFIPNPENLPQINHIDGNKINNNFKNLEWCDRSHNQIHARKLNLQGGERTNTAKLTERDIRAIRKLYPKVNSMELAEAFDIGQSTICKIINKNYWKYV